MAKNILTADPRFHRGNWKILERFEKERKIESKPALAKTKTVNCEKRLEILQNLQRTYACTHIEVQKASTLRSISLSE